MYYKKIKIHNKYVIKYSNILQSVLYHFVAFNNFIKRKKIIYLPAILKRLIVLFRYFLHLLDPTLVKI